VIYIFSTLAHDVSAAKKQRADLFFAYSIDAAKPSITLGPITTQLRRRKVHGHAGFACAGVPIAYV